MNFNYIFVDEEAKNGNKVVQDLLTPKRATPFASGFDLKAANIEPISLLPHQRTLIPTGIAISIPLGYEAQIRPRSGLAHKNGITCLNAPGTIDSDYRGEVKVILINLGEEPFEITRGMRIAQMVIAPVAMIDLTLQNQLDDSIRGEAGFGSTGIL
jgi:dUTP pyrophosphatase